MIQPINNYILIEPLKSDSFIASEKDIYEEIGIVVNSGDSGLFIGSRVYFDSYLAAKYPTGDGKTFFWLVRYEDIRATETNEEIPK
jgi:hypothetical protein